MAAAKISQLPLSMNHAMIYASDVEASLRFYCNALGLKPLEVMLPYYARLKSTQGTTTIALHKLEPGADADAPGVRLYFETPDVSAAAKLVKRGGYAIKSGPKKMPWGWTHVYLDDPDGHEISLYNSHGLRTARGATLPPSGARMPAKKKKAAK
jgi:predicted enzyme related to lactoylglutathione lyase